MIEIKGFKVKKRRVLINNLSIFNQNKEQLVAKNGYGKSTLLSALNKELKYKGEILIDDINLKDHSKLEIFNLISICYQHDYLIHLMSVRNNIKLLKLNLRKIEIYLEMFDRKYILEMNPAELSGGEFKLICVILSLSRKSKYLILDEPFNHLAKDTIKILNLILLYDSRYILVISHKKVDGFSEVKLDK